MKPSRNTNLTIYSADQFKGLPIQGDKGPFFLEYLDRTLAALQRALARHPRLLAIRFDLHYPFNEELPSASSCSDVITRFMESFRSKVTNDRERAAGLYGRVHDTTIGYVWVKEYGADGRPHYHFVLLMNKDAYHTLGRFDSDGENIFTRLVSAWKSALGMTHNRNLGLVHIPESPSYYVYARDGDRALADLFYRVSYMCKVATKRYGDWERAFGCSRI